MERHYEQFPFKEQLRDVKYIRNTLFIRFMVLRKYGTPYIKAKINHKSNINLIIFHSFSQNLKKIVLLNCLLFNEL